MVVGVNLLRKHAEAPYGYGEGLRGKVGGVMIAQGSVARGIHTALDFLFGRNSYWMASRSRSNSVALNPDQ